MPNVQPKRPKAYKTYEGELTTLPGNATVTVSPDGTVTVKRGPKSEDNVKEKSEMKTKQVEENDNSSEETDGDTEED